MPMSRTCQRLALVVAVLTAGCAQLVPHRDEVPRTTLKASFERTGTAPCEPIPWDGSEAGPGEVDPVACGRQVREDAKDYSLYFAEYDDQGWSYREERGAEPGQIFSDDLHQLFKEVPEESVSVVVFVHGWKHNARADDRNVKSFRVLLSDLNSVERQSACGRQGVKRRVIGVYVGWRGRVTDLGLLENATFWNRKEAAQRVALGDVRMLFSDLRELQEKANSTWNAAVASVPNAVRKGQAPSTLDPCAKRMKLSIAGHSFGGLIVYTSMAQSLVRDIVALKHDELGDLDGRPDPRVQPLLQRQGDLIVVVNPAIEATRLHPLFRAVQGASLPHYHSPVFVSVTSVGDVATRVAFPLGRRFSTLWDRYPDSRREEEQEANLYAFGHAEGFATHHLAEVGREALPPDSPCADWRPDDPFGVRLERESANLEAFRKGLREQGASSAATRYFCGRTPMQLKATKFNPQRAGHSPVWNIRADTSIVADHNDYMNPQLLAVLRQLYVEADEQIRAR